jgi:hypothetical protein
LIRDPTKAGSASNAPASREIANAGCSIFDRHSRPLEASYPAEDTCASAALLNGLADHWRADLPGTRQNCHEGGQNLFSFIF